MKTVTPPVAKEDLVGLVCSVMLTNGDVQLYYEGDTLPILYTPEEIAQIEAARQQKEDKLASDETAAKQYQKLTTLANMSPDEIVTWINTNITNLAGAKDGLATLAVGVSVLARKAGLA